ncbi:MAG TPA: hypothetical protein VKE93_21855 [Candidatus Angelobacter sp.]|nr:hypothetical protein [Candidatus Angelobacter sp.]
MIAALGAVALFWLIYLPRSEAYKTYRVEADLKKTLKTIQPPDGAELVNTDSQHVGPVSSVMGIYFSNSKIETLRAHYMREFVRRGFVLKAEDNSETPTTLHFCRPDCDAQLVFTKLKDQSALYMISLYPRGKTC